MGIVCKTTRSHTSGTSYPIYHYVDCVEFSLPHIHILTTITIEKEPIYFHEATHTYFCNNHYRERAPYFHKAMKDTRWRQTMQA